MELEKLKTSPEVAKKEIILYFKNRQLNIYEKIKDLKKKNTWQDDNPALSILFESIEYHQVLIDALESARFSLPSMTEVIEAAQAYEAYNPNGTDIEISASGWRYYGFIEGFKYLINYKREEK